MQQIRAYLSAITPVSDGDWEKISSHLKILSIPKNSVLLKEGQVCNDVYFVVKGLVRLYVVADGKQICRQFFFENSFVSAYDSFLSKQPSKTSADVLEDTTLYYFNHADIQYFYEQIPTFQLIGRVLAENMFIKISERVNSFLTESPELRYTQLVTNRPKVLQRIPQYMIASYLGITPEHLSRIRKKMAGNKASG
ncbi:MAG TPA: Crp/Fnr family transcriptional regulator [Flavisolibacter sp.]|jgi:CRP-like cAMP-binding protein|nr:Crp/Fnr family transcriptional regulator [Flavisolibacter sp.]